MYFVVRGSKIKSLSTVWTKPSTIWCRHKESLQLSFHLLKRLVIELDSFYEDVLWCPTDKITI